MEIEYETSHKKVIRADSKEAAIEKYVKESDKNFDGVVVTDTKVLEPEDTYPTTVHMVKGIVQ